MRLSGGELGRRRVSIPRGGSLRPTQGRVREALFAILSERVAGARLLDLYAGSGAVGLEALSRGAEHVTFVDSHARTAARVRETLSMLRLSDRALVITQPAERVARFLAGPYDIVYADPPFAHRIHPATFERLREAGAITAGTLVVYEHAARETAEIPGYRETRVARYGDVALSFFAADA